MTMTKSNTVMAIRDMTSPDPAAIDEYQPKQVDERIDFLKLRWKCRAMPNTKQSHGRFDCFSFGSSQSLCAETPAADLNFEHSHYNGYIATPTSRGQRE
jgi:hypothetical protein